MAYQHFPRDKGGLQIVRIAADGTVTVWREEDLKSMLPPSSSYAPGCVAVHADDRAVFILNRCETAEDFSLGGPM